MTSTNSALDEVQSGREAAVRDQEPVEHDLESVKGESAAMPVADAQAATGDSRPRQPAWLAPAQPITIVQGIRAHKGLVAVCGLALALLAGALAWVTSPAAQATGQLGLIQPGPDNVLLPVPAGDATMARYTAQRAQFVVSDAVLQEVADSLPETTVEELRNSISVVPSKSANSIVITASGANPSRAVDVARSVMDSYRAATLEDVTTRTEVAAEAARAAGQEAEAESITIEGMAFADGVEFEVTPNLQGAETRQMLSREAILGLLVGIGVGALLAWSIEDSKRRRLDFAGAEEDM